MADPIAATELIQVPKPEIGRPTDRRIDEAYLESRPELVQAGYTPFIDGTDVDIVEKINEALNLIFAQVRFASPTLGNGLIGALTNLLSVLTDLEEVRADTEQDRNAVAVALGNLGAVKAAQVIKPTQAEVNAALLNGEVGFTLDSGRFSHMWNGTISTLGFISTSHIPISGLANSDPNGDIRQRIADAATFKKPLDGGGTEIYVPLGAQSLLVPDRQIRNVRFVFDGLNAGQIALDARPTPRQLAANWTGGRVGDIILTIPGHGLQRGAFIWIYGTENWCLSNSAVKTGDMSNVVERIDANTVRLGRPLRFNYTDFPASSIVGQNVSEFSRFRIENVDMTYSGTQDTYGIWHRYSIGQALTNVRASAFRKACITTQDSIGSEIGVSTFGNVSIDGTNYGHVRSGLNIWRSYASGAFGGRHTESHGGEYPGEYIIHGGYFCGVGDMYALDSHGGVYSIKVSNSQIHGGTDANALINVYENCIITASSELTGVVYAMTGAPVGGTLDFLDCHITKYAQAGNTSSIRLPRSINRKLPNGQSEPLPDVLYERFRFRGGSITHEVAAAGSANDVPWTGDATFRVWDVDTLVKRITQPNTPNRYSTLPLDRLREIRHIQRGNDAIKFFPTVQPSALVAAPDLLDITVDARDVGMHAGGDYVALWLDGTGMAAPAVEAVYKVQITGRNNSSAVLYAANLPSLDFWLDTARSASQTASATLKTAAYILNVPDATLRGGSLVNEAHVNSSVGITLAGTTALTPRGQSRVRGKNSSVSMTLSGGNTGVLATRRGLTQTIGSIPWPTYTGSVTLTAQNVATGIVPTVFNIPITGGAFGDFPVISPPSDLSADLRYTARISAVNAAANTSTVQVRLYNQSAAAISHTGTWGARIDPA